MTFDNGRKVPNMKGKYEASSNEMGGKTEAGMIGNEMMIFGDTDADLADMQRLGKKQGFKVNLFPLLIRPKHTRIVLTYRSKAKFWSDLHPRVHIDIHGNMGICVSVFECGYYRWWVWGIVLSFHWHSHLLWDDCCEFSGDG